MKVTVPVGVGPDPVTVAVKVTDWPKTEGLAEEATVVVEAMPLTATVGLVLAVSVAAASVAVIVWLPVVSKMKLDNVFVPLTSVRFPLAPPLSSAITALASELVMMTLGVAVLIMFQLASTALTLIAVNATVTF